MKNQTEQQYTEVIKQCQDIFEKKTRDYGTAWRILRIPSITDQIYIKAQRIRSLQEKKEQKVAEGQQEEFVAIVNYCIMAMIQLQLSPKDSYDMPLEIIKPLYEQAVEETKQLVLKKNHDYDEAWRNMRISSITDIILMKLLRVKQIEDNLGQTEISEGVHANYQDMMNYAIFCLIKFNEHE